MRFEDYIQDDEILFIAKVDLTSLDNDLNIRDFEIVKLTNEDTNERLTETPEIRAQVEAWFVANKDKVLKAAEYEASITAD